MAIHIDDVNTQFLSNDPIAIVGMGPGGMTAALELAKKGKKVIIFDNRDYFSRIQRVALSKKTIDYIIALDKGSPKGYKRSEEEKWFLRELQEVGIVEIAELQDFLKRKMETLYPHLITIKQGSHIKVNKINAENNMLEYVDNHISRTVSYEHIVAADGVRHQTADLLASQNNVEMKYNELEVQLRQKAHGTINLTIHGDVQPNLRAGRELNINDFPVLRELGWDKPYLPKTYVWPSSRGRRFYIAGEVPDVFLKLKDESRRDALVKWGQAILAKTYGIKPRHTGLNLLDENHPTLANKHKAANQLKTTAFPIVLQYVQRSAIELNNHHAFIQIGDACRNANFLLAHGTNDAMNDAIVLAQNLNENNAFNIEEINNHHLAKKKGLVFSMREVQLPSILSEYQKMTQYFQVELKKLYKDINKIVRSLEKNKEVFKDIHEGLNTINVLIQENRVSEAYEHVLDVCQSIHVEIMLNPELTLNEKDRKKIKRLDKEIQASKDLPASDRFVKFIVGGISKVAEFLEGRENERARRAKEIMAKNEKAKTKILEDSVNNSSKRISSFQNTMTYLKESQILRDEMEREYNKTEKQKQSHQDNHKGSGKPHI